MRNVFHIKSPKVLAATTCRNQGITVRGHTTPSGKVGRGVVPGWKQPFTQPPSPPQTPIFPRRYSGGSGGIVWASTPNSSTYTHKQTNPDTTQIKY